MRTLYGPAAILCRLQQPRKGVPSQCGEQPENQAAGDVEQAACGIAALEHCYGFVGECRECGESSAESSGEQQVQAVGLFGGILGKQAVEQAYQQASRDVDYECGCGEAALVPWNDCRDKIPEYAADAASESYGQYDRIMLVPLLYAEGPGTVVAGPGWSGGVPGRRAAAGRR